MYIVKQNNQFFVTVRCWSREWPDAKKMDEHDSHDIATHVRGECEVWKDYGTESETLVARYRNGHTY